MLQAAQPRQLAAATSDVEEGLRERGGCFLLGLGALVADGGAEREEVEHAEWLAAPGAPGNTRAPIEVDHVFAVRAEIVGHVQIVGLMGQSSNRVETP